MVYNVEPFQRLQVALSQIPVMDHNCVTWTMDIILSAKKDKQIIIFCSTGTRKIVPECA